MPEPEADWIDGGTPPVRGWRVVYKYLGLADAVLHSSADACFAANAVCRRVYSRYPVDSAFHYRPLTKFDPGPLCPDLDADGAVGNRGDSYEGTDPNADPLRGDAASGTGDGDSPRGTSDLRANHRDAGGEQDLFLGSGAADPDGDSDPATVRDARAINALSKGGVDAHDQSC